MGDSPKFFAKLTEQLVPPKASPIDEHIERFHLAVDAVERTPGSTSARRALIRSRKTLERAAATLGNSPHIFLQRRPGDSGDEHVKRLAYLQTNDFLFIAGRDHVGKYHGKLRFKTEADWRKVRDFVDYYYQDLITWRSMSPEYYSHPFTLEFQ